MNKRPGARKQYLDRQAVRLLLPIDLIEYIDSKTTNRTQWLISAAQEKKERETVKKVTSQHIFNLYMSTASNDAEKSQLRAAYPEYTAPYDEKRSALDAKSAKLQAEMDEKFGPIQKEDTSKIEFSCDPARKVGDIVEHDGRKYEIYNVAYVSHKEATDLEENEDVWVDPGYYAQARLIDGGNDHHN